MKKDNAGRKRVVQQAGRFPGRLRGRDSESRGPREESDCEYGTVAIRGRKPKQEDDDEG